MDNTINIRGFETPEGTMLDIDCQATPQIMVNAAYLLLTKVNREACPKEAWGHIQSAINCLSLISKSHDISEAELLRQPGRSNDRSIR